MNRLFNTLRGIVERPRAEPEAAPIDDALPNFESRIEVLTSYAERSAAYEDDLAANYEKIIENLTQLQGLMEAALDAGKDRDALEYLRLAARIRPQRDLLDRELRAFHSVADDLIGRVNTLKEYIDEAREYAQNASLSPAATFFLDNTLNRLTRYFILLERVTRTRHNALPARLAEQITFVVDDRQLDLEMATYILARRRALGTGQQTEE